MPVQAPPQAQPRPAPVLAFSRHTPARPPASLWDVEELHAHEHGVRVGLLRISYVPSQRFAPLAADIYAYARARNKLSHYAGAVHGLSDLSHKDKASMAFRVQEMLQGWAAANASKWSQQEEAAIDAALERFRAPLEQRLGPERTAFADFHVDNPLVDYIEVHPDHRRRGIGTQLYRQGAAWMAERGLFLHASGIQTPPAQRAWEAMMSQGWVQAVPCADPKEPARRRLAPR